MKKLISCLLILALALSLAACGLSLGGRRGEAEKAKEQKPAVIRAMLREDGTAYIPLDKGEIIKINDEVKGAQITRDRQTVLVLLADGTLYYTDPELSEKHQVSDNAAGIYALRNEGFFYEDMDRELYRVTFGEEEKIDLGEGSIFVAADNSLSCLYYNKDGGVFILKAEDTEPEKISSHSGGIFVEDISDDGSLACWTVFEDGELTLYLSENGEKETLGSFSNPASIGYYTYVLFTEDQGAMVVCNTYHNELYIKKPGEEVVKAKLGNELNSTSIYTAQGLITRVAAEDVGGLYVQVDADKDHNVYFISLDGERERVLSGVKNFAASKGYIVYRDGEDTLYLAQLDGAELKEESKIAGDVDAFRVQGDYVYYFRNCEGISGTLYCRKLSDQDGEPVKIASDAGCSYGSYYTGIYVSFNESGDTVFYFRDLEEAKDGRPLIGTLYSWTYGAEESTKIASDVIQGTLTSFLVNGYIVPDRLGFMKFDSVDGSSGKATGDLYYYDGSEATRIASEILYN